MMHTSEADCKGNGVVENVTTFRVLTDAKRRELSRAKLSGKDWAILMALMKFSHNGVRAAFPCNDSLAREADTVGRNVQTRLGKLEGKGVIRRTTATSEEAGATHRLIELSFLEPGWKATQDSGPTTKKSSACRAHDRSWGGAHDRAPNEDERYQDNLATDAADAARGPDGAVADLPPSSSPRPPRRATRPRRPAQPQPPTKDELVAIEKALIEAEAEICQGYFRTCTKTGPEAPTAEQLIGQDMPQIAAAIERLAELHGRLLGDPGGVATYRNRIARAWALELKAEGYLEVEPTMALRKKLIQTLRMWGWGKVKNPPAFYTKAADKLFDRLEAELNDDAPKRQTAKAKTASRPSSEKASGPVVSISMEDARANREREEREQSEAVQTGNPRQHLQSVAKAKDVVLRYLAERDRGKYPSETLIIPMNDQEEQNLLKAIQELSHNQEGEIYTNDLEGKALDAATRRLDQYERLKSWVETKRRRHTPPAPKPKAINGPPDDESVF
jgi:hypothetical protein